MMRSLTKTDSNMSDARVQGWNVIRQVLPYLWPDGNKTVKLRVIASMAALLLSQVIAVFAPLLFSQAVDSLTPKGPTDATFWGLAAIGLTLAFGIARLTSTGLMQLRDVIFTRVSQGALRALALQTFTHIHRLSMRYHITRKTGGLSRIIERGVKGVEFLLRFLLFSVGPLILQLLMILAVLLGKFDVWYVLVVVCTIGLYVWFTFAVTEWRVKIRKQMNDQDTDANQKAIDSLINFETVKYFGAENWEADRYDDAMRQYETFAIQTNYTLAFLNFGQALLITGGLVGVMIMAAIGVQNATLSVGDFVLVNSYMIQIMMPLNFLGTVYREIRQALIDMGEMFDLLQQPAEVVDKTDAKVLNVQTGEIILDNVHFGYHPERNILKGVSITAKPGQTIAIVGSSGSGKSTIGRLLFRFYDVNSGSLQIDGQDLRDVTQTSLHEQIGVVPQDTVLFNDTVHYNIAYGRPTASDDEIFAVAKAAKIHDFIVSLPDGYQTTVGERGLKLSGGEKQRIGIARTLLKNPPILLLDEATSALDTQTEMEIQAELKAMAKGRTVIMIAHRLSTIAHADQIVVLEDGIIVERGTHDVLLAVDGRYSHLWNRQSEDDTISA